MALVDWNPRVSTVEIIPPGQMTDLSMISPIALVAGFGADRKKAPYEAFS